MVFRFANLDGTREEEILGSRAQKRESRIDSLVMEPRLATTLPLPPELNGDGVVV